MESFTFVLIPGAGGSAWYWHLVAPMLQERGHEVVPVELPAADDHAGLPEYAANIVRAIGDRDAKHLILVAQSLAGFTVPLVCQKVPEYSPQGGEAPEELARWPRSRGRL